MLAAVALALSMLGSGDDAQISARSLKVGDWTAVVRSDRFTGEITCSLKAHAISFHRDTLVFNLGREIDSSQAFFRIDGGPARSVREPQLQNETHGFFLDSGPVDNPSGGRVALPLALVQDAKQVMIRASPRHPPRIFDLARFSEALSAAKTAGCKDQSF
ncbi:MAG TPA: hypothetical protein VHY32_00785 [Caulobacteraceae bacterium]|jgi:hypothetical protein|nr:hypothetical protein [Caulobacteraceae bacterium]